MDVSSTLSYTNATGTASSSGQVQFSLRTATQLRSGSTIKICRTCTRDNVVPSGDDVGVHGRVRGVASEAATSAPS